MDMAFGALPSYYDPYGHQIQGQREHDHQVKPEVLDPGIENFRDKVNRPVGSGQELSLPWIILKGVQLPHTLPTVQR